MLLKAIKSVCARIRGSVVGLATKTSVTVRAASNVVRQRTKTFYRAAVLALFMLGTATALHAAGATRWVANKTRHAAVRVERSMGLSVQKLTAARAPYLKSNLQPVPTKVERLEPSEAGTFRDAPVNFVILVDGAVESLFHQLVGKRSVKQIASA